MEDHILAIAGAVVSELNRELKRTIKGLTEAAEDKAQGALLSRNVRELRYVLERAMIFTQGSRLDADDLVLVAADSFDEVFDAKGNFHFPTGSSLEDLECAYILHTLKHFHQQLLGLRRYTGHFEEDTIGRSAAAMILTPSSPAEIAWRKSQPGSLFSRHD